MSWLFKDKEMGKILSMLCGTICTPKAFSSLAHVSVSLKGTQKQINKTNRETVTRTNWSVTLRSRHSQMLNALNAGNITRKELKTQRKEE